MFVGLNELLNNLGLVIRPQHMIQAKPHPQQQSQSQSRSQSRSQPHPTNGKTIKRRFENRSATAGYNKGVQGLSAEFIEHKTLPEGTECVFDRIQTKKWRLKNNGTKEWGYNVELVFFSGNQSMVLNKRVSVQNCQPGKMMDVQTSIKIPNRKGRYIAYYRLHNGNTPFGPKLCADIIALEKVKKKTIKSVPEPSGNSSQSSDDGGIGHSYQPQNDNNDGTKAKGRRLSMVLSKNVPAISCICGEYLMATRPSLAHIQFLSVLDYFQCVFCFFMYR